MIDLVGARIEEVLVDDLLEPCGLVVRTVGGQAVTVRAQWHNDSTAGLWIDDEEASAE